MNLNDLTFQEKLGQMMMVGFEGKHVNDRVKDLILKYKVGGVILYKKNYDSYEEMLKLIKDLKELNKVNKVPLFIAIDQEGGRVNRMPNELLNLPSAHLLAKSGGEKLVKKAYSIIGDILYDSGINMNFAPVFDIKRFSDNHAIGDRAFGENKKDVTKYGIDAMQELQRKNVISVIKHFPGHGITKKDSHFFLPIVEKDIEQIENVDMMPFKIAIRNGADAVMVSHIVIKSVSRTLPASLSRKFIGKYLRQKLKFKGLVITDDLKMRAIRFIYGYKLAVRQAFTSGSDIVLFRFTPKDEKNAIEQVYNMARSGVIKEYRVNRSTKRILNLKQKYSISDDVIYNGVDVENINEKIQEIRDETF
ncbi:MAG: beta-N-acetylhexosaminidase [Clostridia bacterium]|nr:beta-N-acetylhexosaminidase [Clostridia bacterium]